MRHGRVLGTLTLTHVRLDHFPPPMVELLEAIAAQAAIAIENARLFGEVQRLAITDGLTGLYNRRHLLQMAEAELTRHLPISVVLADIDLFKQVNDTRGHMVGDEVLCGVVERLRAVLEARQCGFLGRYGGEEFAAILPGCPLAKAREHAEELRRAVCQSPIETSGGALTATVSFGVAEAPADAAELRELLRRADERLYEAKKAGRNCVR
jgi:diguanylate cyclase (GGDEF)-like protein